MNRCLLREHDLNREQRYREQGCRSLPCDTSDNSSQASLLPASPGDGEGDRRRSSLFLFDAWGNDLNCDIDGRPDQEGQWRLAL